MKSTSLKMGNYTLRSMKKKRLNDTCAYTLLKVLLDKLGQI